MKTKRCDKCQRRRPLKKLYRPGTGYFMCDLERACTAVWYGNVLRLQAQYRGTHNFASQLAEAKSFFRFRRADP